MPKYIASGRFGQALTLPPRYIQGIEALPRSRVPMLAWSIVLLQSASPVPARGYEDPRTRLLGASGFGDMSSPLANPAAMVEADYTRLFLSSYHGPGSWPGGQYLGLTAPLSPGYFGHALSAGVYGEWDGDDPGLNPAFGPRGPERTYQAGYAFRMPSSLPLSHQLAFGVNGFWHQFDRGTEDRGWDWGMDLGLHWNPVYSSRAGELYLDAALLNVLSPYRAYRVDTAAGGRPRALPLDFNGGMLWRSPQRDLDLHAGLLVQDVDEGMAPGRGYRPGGGVTWHPRRAWELELRYNPLGFPEVGGAYRLYGEGRLQILECRSRLSYGMIQMGLSASLFTRKDLRLHPVQYRRLRHEPDDSRQEARRLYSLGKYYLAAYALGRAMDRLPAHLALDSSAFEFGMSLDKLGFHALARGVFRENLKRFSDGNHTRLIADNMQELMRLDYLVGEYDTALARDSLFQVRFPGSPFAPTFAYFKAQICFLRGRYDEAVPLYAGVPEGHAYYPEARHNLALCRLKTGAVREAIATFAALLDAPRDSGGADIRSADIRESATVKTGMILHGLKDPRADALLAGIGPASAYLDEALLVRSWSAVRRGDFPQAESLTDSLLASRPRSPLAKEACFLNALAVFRQGRDQEALRLADSVLAGEWREFLLPEEAEAVRLAEAESASYDSLRMAYYQSVTDFTKTRVCCDCGRMVSRQQLEELRRRQDRAETCRRREAKAVRYAQSREEASAMAARLRGILLD